MTEESANQLGRHGGCTEPGVSQQSEQLKERAMRFSLKVLQLVDTFPRTPGWEVVARQLGKSATSIGANYIAACTSRSRAEFLAKLQIVSEEADETVYWMELVSRRGRATEVEGLKQESVELRAIFARSLGTARWNNTQQPHLATAMKVRRANSASVQGASSGVEGRPSESRGTK